MKQHILPKQAQEVSENKFYSLFDDVVKRNDWYKYHHKKVTIGLMIEFLCSKNWKLEIYSHSNFFRVANNNKNGLACSRDELCDALWECVKRELEKEDE